MKNKILSWLVTIGLCIVLIPIGCILLILNILTYRKLRKLEKIVNNESFNEIHCWNTFSYSLIIFMSGVMKSDHVTIIIVNT